MSDQAMKAEFADRIDRLSELVEAERELRAAMSNFEEAQRAVVQSAERLQDWADRWDDCRQRVLSVVADDDLTTQKATEYKLSDANDVMRRFCDEVELKREAIAALSVPEVAEVEIPEGFTKWEGGDCPVAPGTLVKVIHRDGDVLYSVAGDDYAADWTHCDGSGDIIAYRVLPIEPAAEAKGEEYVGVEFMDGNSNDGGDGYARFAAFKKPDPFVASTQNAEESLPPLFPAEPPQPATPEELEKMGVTDPGASAMARMLSTAQAGHVRKGWPL